MTPPSARIRPGISILYLRKACAHATSSDPPSRNAPHTVVRVRLRASYDFGGDTSTHAPAPIPATQPNTIATLYTRKGGTGYGEDNTPSPPCVQFALHSLGGALVEHAIHGRARPLLQQLNGLRTARLAARVLPPVRRDAVPQLGVPVRLTRNLAVLVRRAQILLQRPPRLRPHAPVNLPNSVALALEEPLQRLRRSNTPPAIDDQLPTLNGRLRLRCGDSSATTRHARLHTARETIQPPQIPVAGALRRSPATMRRQRQVPVHGAEVSDQRSSGLLRRGAARHIRVKLDPDLVMVRLAVPRMPGATVGIDNAPHRVLRHDV